MIDLFETPELIPTNVGLILSNITDDISYKDLHSILLQVEKLGYTFEYYLDAVPFNLRIL